VFVLIVFTHAVRAFAKAKRKRENHHVNEKNSL
jgi:hypothetical protein